MDEYERRDILQTLRGMEVTVARDMVESAPHGAVPTGGQVASKPVEPPTEPDIKRCWVGIRGLDASVTG